MRAFGGLRAGQRDASAGLAAPPFLGRSSLGERSWHFECPTLVDDRHGSSPIADRYRRPRHARTADERPGPAIEERPRGRIAQPAMLEELPPLPPWPGEAGLEP